MRPRRPDRPAGPGNTGRPRRLTDEAAQERADKGEAGLAGQLLAEGEAGEAQRQEREAHGLGDARFGADVPRRLNEGVLDEVQGGERVGAGGHVTAATETFTPRFASTADK